MKIILTPQRSDESLTLQVEGDVLTVNGRQHDFTPLQEGFELPFHAVDDSFITGTVRRVGGVVEVTVRLPYGLDAQFDTTQPVVVNQSSGVVEVPR